MLDQPCQTLHEVLSSEPGALATVMQASRAQVELARLAYQGYLEGLKWADSGCLRLGEAAEQASAAVNDSRYRYGRVLLGPSCCLEYVMDQGIRQAPILVRPYPELVLVAHLVGRVSDAGIKRALVSAYLSCKSAMSGVPADQRCFVSTWWEDYLMGELVWPGLSLEIRNEIERSVLEGIRQKIASTRTTRVTWS